MPLRYNEPSKIEELVFHFFTKSQDVFLQKVHFHNKDSLSHLLYTKKLNDWRQLKISQEVLQQLNLSPNEEFSEGNRYVQVENTDTIPIALE